MRNINALHPRLQAIIPKLKEECKKAGIIISIGECVRTVAEQDALYAKGRTAPGSVVTNCKGTTYSSMHQWGVAFDFYLSMDVDGDGQTNDDAFNNAKKHFQKVGAIGKSLGLEWGGEWTSIVDMPHFQLPDWGSTALKLKEQFGTPDKFMLSWNNTAKTVEEIAKEVINGKYGNGQERKKAIEKLGYDYEEVQLKVNELLGKKTSTTSSSYSPNPGSKNITEPAKYKDLSVAKKYVTTTGLNLRTGAGTGKEIIICMPKGAKVQCYGYYPMVNGVKWLYVQYGKYTGYCSINYLKHYVK